MSPSSPETEAGKDALRFLDPEYSPSPAWRESIAAIEAQARRDALLALRATVEGLPIARRDSRSGHPVIDLISRHSVLSAIEHQLEAGGNPE